MKVYLKTIVNFFVSIFIKFLSSINAGRYVKDLLLEKISNTYVKIEHNKVKLFFYTPNRLCYWRVKTFSTKEPETIKWIDGFDENCQFWDIGSNIGLYSCYAAKKKINVMSFEPSVFNLEILAKNVFKNNLENLITIVPIAISNSTQIKSFNMSNINYGGAMSSLEKNLYNQDGIQLKQVFNYNLVSMEIRKLSELLKLKKPDHIKIDVDGIEHLIIENLDGLISNTKSILVEVDKKFQNNLNTIEKFLLTNNFYLQNSYQGSKSQFNQIWFRK